jgi:hypothetical protein
MDDLDAYMLLYEPLTELDLCEETRAFLQSQSISTIGELMDREWALFPSQIADEVLEAVEKAGLREAGEGDSGEHAPSTPQEEWDRIIDRRQDRYHVCAPGESDADFELLMQESRWGELTSLWVEHWGKSDAGDDFRPWFDALIERPPPLVELEFGGYGDRSKRSTLGSIRELLTVLVELESLFVVGDLSDLGTLESASLRSLTLQTFVPPESGWGRVFSASMLPGLADLELVHEAPKVSASELVPVFEFPLERLDIFGFDLSLAFVEAMCGAAGRLEEVDLSGNQMPFETPDEERAIIDALVESAERLGDVDICLPTDALDFRAEIEAAGLRCSFGF